MGFGEAISSGLKNVTNFSGRASRSEFWWFVLFIWIVSVVLNFVLGSLIGLNGDSTFGTGFFIVYVLQILAVIGVGCRRLHDTGKSGWLQLLWIIPCVGPIIMIIFWVQAGQPGDNAHGPAVS